MQKKSIKNLDDLKLHILELSPSIYTGSQTSTVIPYTELDNIKDLDHATLVHLSSMEKKWHLDESFNLHIEGPITWNDVLAELRLLGRDLMTMPTEELATILAGVNTSATGERCYGFGALRDQIIEVTFMGQDGSLDTLHSLNQLMAHPVLTKYKSQLEKYHNDYLVYEQFKNAPFPRLEKETDLVVGSEGQIGVVVKIVLKTIPYYPTTFLAIKTAKWEEDISSHLEIFTLAQQSNWRKLFYGCEFTDANSLSVLDPSDRPVDGMDLILLEVPQKDFENAVEMILEQLTTVNPENIFEFPYKKCIEMRMKIPRKTFEVNERAKVTKKGTDVQVSPKHFVDLLMFYREMALKNIKYNLFGHFGDAHLHFNFMPTVNEIALCDKQLEKLYEKVLQWNGSPFAEHGIGFLKQKFIKPFLNKNQIEMFAILKYEFDRSNIFFPHGLWSKSQEE